MSFDNEARNRPKSSFSEDKTNESIDYEHGATLTRRQMMIATAGATLASSAMGTTAAASYNFESEYSPTSRVPEAVTIDEHTDGMTSALKYLADDEPHNPVRYWPDQLERAPNDEHLPIRRLKLAG